MTSPLNPRNKQKGDTKMAATSYTILLHHDLFATAKMQQFTLPGDPACKHNLTQVTNRRAPAKIVNQSKAIIKINCNEQYVKWTWK